MYIPGVYESANYGYLFSEKNIFNDQVSNLNEEKYMFNGKKEDNKLLLLFCFFL